MAVELDEIMDLDLEKAGKEIYFKGYPGLMITGNAESQHFVWISLCLYELLLRLFFREIIWDLHTHTLSTLFSPPFFAFPHQMAWSAVFVFFSGFPVQKS